MALELRIAGPGLDLVRRLEQGESELVLGRDSDCDVCLPDPQRNVSRHHLALWLEGDHLHFRVLSVVNGVELPSGMAAPGACGILPLEQTLKLADYTVAAVPAGDDTVPAPVPAAAPAAEPADPWAVFDRDGTGASASAAPDRASMASGQTGGFAAAEDDPFGDWGFQSTFGPSAAGTTPLEAGELGPGELSAFIEGLGLDPATVGALSQGEIESLGRLVRTMVLGLLELHASAGGVKKDLRSEDRTMVAVKDNNPLKTDWPEETKLRYLFGGRSTSIGFVNPERALRELLVDLIVHNNASAAAARAAVESTIREFAPEVLKNKLLGGGTKFFEGARAWDAYAKFYQEQGQDMPRWSQRLLDKYFTEAYLRESLRIRRETPPHKR